MRHLLKLFLAVMPALAAAAAEQQFTTKAVKSDKLTLAPFVRRDVPLNAGWTFTREEKVKEKGEGEQTVDLPHDYQFEQPWVKAAGGARGFKACGTKGVYENTFSYDPAWDGKRVFLEFEAIMSHGEVEVNGKKVGECDYGYLGCTLDVTDRLVKDKPNTVKVTCSTGSQRGSRWYTGGGLIRPVHIIVKSPVSVVEDGLFVKCEKVGGESRWTAAVQVQLDGYRGRGRKNELKIWTTIKDPDGKVVGTGETIAPWSKLRHQLVDLEPIAVANPKLWDIDSPNLYTCEVKLVLNGAEVDQVSDRFGFRTVEFDKDFGFKLNGRKVWVFGMANHHDLGALGAAAFDDGIRRMMRTIKRFGYNTIRCAHNPYSKGFYRIADEEGLLVIDELYDKWGFGGGTWWIGSKTQRETWPAHVKRWMMRDRNHPSVILWSLGNEFQMNEDICGYDTDDWGVTTYRMMREYARRYDPTRLTTAAMFPSRAGGVGKNDPKDLYNTYTPPELATVTDVSSFNYQPHAYAGYLERAPWMILLQSEATTSEWLKPMNLMDRAKMVGLCYWGAIEYWGESNRWPKKGWNYSFFNETLEPYPTAWLITSGAYPEKSIVRIGVLERGGEMTNWNEQKSGQDKIRENWTREPGTKAQVAVFSNQDEVELFLNGRSLGKKSVPHDASEKSNVVWYRDVVWEPGELKAVGKGRSKSEEGRSEIVHAIYSAGPVDHLAVKIDYEGEELIYARIVGVDAAGRENLAAKGRVRVTVSGGGRLYALSNGDHATDELFTPDIDTKALHDGTLLAIVRKIPGAKEPVKINAQFVKADFINGPVVRKVVVNERAIEGRAEWRVTGLGVFTCSVNGREVGAADALKPGYTEVTKRRAVYTYDVTDYLNCGAGETNIFSAIVTDGWWSDQIVSRPKEPRRHPAFWCDGIVATDTSWECSTNTPVKAGIYEGESYDARVVPVSWRPATVNTEFKGELVPCVGAKVGYRKPLKPVRSWKVNGKTVWDFGQNCAAVPRLELKGKPGAVFRARLGEILNDGVKGHHGDGPKGTVYLANLRSAPARLSYTFTDCAQPSTHNTPITYQPKYTFFGYRYLQVEDNPDVEVVSVESVPVTSVTEDLDRGWLEVGDKSLNRLVQNALWGMRSNYLSIPTDCPQRDERYGWTADTQVFAETGLYFADVKDFFRKWMQDLRDVQFDNGLFPDVAPHARWSLVGGHGAWADAGIVVPYRVWRATGDGRIVEENWDAMMRFMRFIDATGYQMKMGDWLLCDWLSFEKLKVDNRNRWSNGTFTADHLSYQNFINACYAVSDCQMMREMGEKVGVNSEKNSNSLLQLNERKFREKIRKTWLNADGSLTNLFDTMMTPRLLAMKIGAGDVARHHRELVGIIRGNGNRLATGFVGTSELTEQLSRVGEHALVWDILTNHAFPGWLYSVDQGATTIWERWNGYTKDRGFGDVTMNSYNHYAYGSVVGWLFKYAAGIQPGKDGGYKSFTLAPHPDKRAGSLKAALDTPEGRIVSDWWYEGGKLCWHYEIPKGTDARILPPEGAEVRLDRAAK